MRSGLHGACIGASGWGAHLYFNSRSSAWLRKWPLLAEIAVRAIVIAIVVSIVAVALEVVLYYDHRLDAAWLSTQFPRVVAIAFVFSVLFGAVFELTRLIGGRALLNVMLGRYRHPT
jgi:adenylate cyclase